MNRIQRLTKTGMVQEGVESKGAALSLSCPCSHPCSHPLLNAELYQLPKRLLELGAQKGTVEANRIDRNGEGFSEFASRA